MYIKLALGQVAKDRVPLPAELALEWLRTDPNTMLRTPAIRCPEAFARLFKFHFDKTFGDNFVLPRPNTRLKLSYSPASAVFRGQGDVNFTFDDTPNVSMLTTPLSKLKLIAEVSADGLDAYSRFVGKFPEYADSIEAQVNLPVETWPEHLKAPLDALCAEIHAHVVTLPLGEVLARFDKTTPLTKDQAASLAKAMLSVGMGMEPDVLAGAKVPALTDMVALFATDEVVSDSTNTPVGLTNSFETASLSVTVAALVLSEVPAEQAQGLAYLKAQVQGWNHLTAAHLSRLQGQVALLVPNPNVLKTLKKRLQSVSPTTKEPLVALITGVALAQGELTPVALQSLEKLYKAMSLDAAKVFSDVHAHATSGPRKARTRATPAHGDAVMDGASGELGLDEAPAFVLDTAKIASLQQESNKVAVLLAGIFSDDEPTPLKVSAPVAPDALTAADNVPSEQVLEGAETLETVTDAASESVQVSGTTEPTFGKTLAAATVPPILPGLDEAHDIFARKLLTQSQWATSELQAIADGLGLMLEGALERINDASFDTHDTPFTEGDDPLEVNPDILELLKL
jgi:hypothetical protein